MLVGLPGMGKDYYIESRCADMPVVSLDAIRRKHKFSPTDKAANGWVAQTAKEQAGSIFERDRTSFGMLPT